MQLRLNERQIDIDVNTSNTDDLIQIIQEEVEKQGGFFSHLRIDEVEVYEDIDIYITDRWDNMQQIEIVVKTEKEFVHELLATSIEYLKGAMPAVETLANQLYQGSNQETWDKLVEFLDGLQWLSNMVDTIHNSKITLTRWPEMIAKFENINSHYPELNRAIESKDLVLVGDILSYEMIPELKAALSELQNIKDHEVVPNDIN